MYAPQSGQDDSKDNFYDSLIRTTAKFHVGRKRGLEGLKIYWEDLDMKLETEEKKMSLAQLWE